MPTEIAAPILTLERLAHCEHCGSDYTSTRSTSFASRYPNEEWGWSRCPTCAEREQREAEELERSKAARRRVDAIKIPPKFTTATFDSFETPTQETKRAREIVAAYAHNFATNQKIGRSLVLIGEVGTGKTHLACALLRFVAIAGFSARYRTSFDVIRELRQSWSDSDAPSETRVLEWLTEPALLVIDEVAAAYGSDAERAQLGDLIDLRYRNMRPTVVVSNGDIEDLNRCLGPRAVDRLRDEGGYLITLTGKSWRGSNRQAR